MAKSGKVSQKFWEKLVQNFREIYGTLRSALLHCLRNVDRQFFTKCKYLQISSKFSGKKFKILGKKFQNFGEKISKFWGKSQNFGQNCLSTFRRQCNNAERSVP